MAETTHRAAIKTLVQTVSNVGVVYNYQRLATEWDILLNLFKTTISGSDVIRGWQITCTDVAQEGRVMTGQYNTGNRLGYTYAIRGLFGVDDSASSETVALGISRSVQDALTSSTLFSADVQEVTLPQMTFGYRNLGGVLCHYAEITLTIWERT